MKSAAGRLDSRLVDIGERHSDFLLRGSVGIIYFVFGFLKLFPQYSPAEELAGRTIELVSFGMLRNAAALRLLAFIEMGIATILFCDLKRRWVVGVALWHMGCTFLPMVLLPGETFTEDPISLTLLGQYIVKNLVIVAALIAIYSKAGAARGRETKKLGQYRYSRRIRL